MEFVLEDIGKLAFAIVIGSIIGAEREYRDKSAGFRTLVFICVGAALFTILSLKIDPEGNPARIAAQIVSGVGFLGAGAILRDQRRIVGLTTAAMIWLTAALGMGIGSGHYVLSGLGAVMSLIVLWIFPYIEEWIDSLSGTEHYEVICAQTPGRYEELLAKVKEMQLTVITSKCNKTNQKLVISMMLQGPPKQQAALADSLLNDPNILEFRH